MATQIMIKIICVKFIRKREKDRDRRCTFYTGNPRQDGSVVAHKLSEELFLSVL